MLILVINAGSSSLKAQLLRMEDGTCLMKALAEKVGAPGTFMNISFPPGGKLFFDMADATIEGCLAKLIDVMTTDPTSPIDSLDDIAAVGNRIVSGGEYFTHSVLVDEEVLALVRECGAMAPLHNYAEADCIAYLMKRMPDTPQVTVFDNAFHMTMPPKAFMYPLPYRLYEEYHIRRYGAHGTSHAYAAQRAAELLGRPAADVNAITCHLGNGGSVSAVKGGVCQDTTMGLTPLEGIMMGTRCGSIDPAIIPFVMERDPSLTPADMDRMMNRESGFLGVSGVSGDCREVMMAAADNPRAKLAIDMYVYRVQKAIGEMFAVLPRTDAVVMTAGIGENSAEVRAEIFEGLEHLGMKIDLDRNAQRGDDRVISADDSPVAIAVVHADEEMRIASETKALVAG